MQKVKNRWKQILILAVIIMVCAIYVREKYFYKSLFSKEFCESIVEIQYVSYEKVATLLNYLQRIENLNCF